MPSQKNLDLQLKYAKKIAIIGVGSELRGDDIAGLLVIHRLKKRLSALKLARRVKCFYGGTAPENLTGEIRRFLPTHLIIVDSLDIGKKPGTLVVLSPAEVGSGVSFSTHKMPIKVMIEYLSRSLNCEITLVGIQPKSLDFNSPASKPIKKSITAASNLILKSIRTSQDHK